MVPLPISWATTITIICKEAEKKKKDTTKSIPLHEESIKVPQETDCFTDHDESDTEEQIYNDFTILTGERKYVKNSSYYMLGSPQNSLGRRNKSSKELISRKQRNTDREKSEKIKSFFEADSEGETEFYRKSLVNEMDLEVAKMKSDGFIDDDGNDDNEIAVFIEDTEEGTHGGNGYEVDVDNTSEPLSRNNVLNLNNGYNNYKELFDELDRKIKMIQNKCQLLECEAQHVDNEEHIDGDKHEFVGEKAERNIRTEEEDNCKTPDDENELINNEENGIVAENFSEEKKSNNELYKENENERDILGTSQGNDAIYSEEQINEDGRKMLDKYIIEETDKCLPCAASEDLENIAISSPSRSVNFDDDFYGNFGDDLENGSYFVEAYNDDGRELVIVEISLERKTINFDKPFSLENIKQSINDADMVFHEKADKSLNVIDDPKDLVSNNEEIIPNEFCNDPDSNRSTFYSTTSRESDLFDTDDEGIGLGNIEGKSGAGVGAYNNTRRETFSDDKGIVRIVRVGYLESIHSDSLEDLQTPVSRNNSFLQKESKLSYIIEEIKSTEKKYVADLNKVVRKYIPYIARHTPPNLNGRQSYIFGNIETLYEHQKLFLEALENCEEEVEEVLKIFIDFKELFKLYPKYFKNKPRADSVLKEFNFLIKQAQDKFNERLDLTSYLLTPLQRLGKYKLFLENIEKQLRKLHLPTENATTALEIIKEEMSKGNDFVAIESIDHSPIAKGDYGSFKMREMFTIVRPRRMESMVFLFENVVVFTTPSSNKSTEMYNYHDSIKMNDLRIATFEDSTIHLTNFTKETENTLRMYKSNPTKRSKSSRSRVKSAEISALHQT
ncbi:hypothetical protein NQ318_008834 [Aromia moschata]|uniref:DH domain-containing protein n=1 Tax=Aromia moschata TaxID=1265417 RepID=A0AAV8ZAN5_9CUCU|nr:hypothetical protein NQ318_008834 [Aromia moschata]